MTAWLSGGDSLSSCVGDDILAGWLSGGDSLAVLRH